MLIKQYDSKAKDDSDDDDDDDDDSDNENDDNGQNNNNKNEKSITTTFIGRQAKSYWQAPEMMLPYIGICVSEKNSTDAWYHSMFCLG